MAYEIEEEEVYGMRPGGEKMTLQDGLLREKYGPGNLEVEDFYNPPGETGEGMVVEMEGGDPEFMGGIQNMSDEELMAEVNAIPTEGDGADYGPMGDDMEDEEGVDGGPSGPMAYTGSTAGVGTPEGENEFIEEAAEARENPQEMARQLLARRAAARMNRSQNFQEKAEEMNSQDPFKQYMG